MRSLQISLTAAAMICALIVTVFIGGKDLGNAVTSSSTADANTINPSWHEARWPFLMDQWGLGRAFRCEAKHCGTEINVYVRAKIGFCNCTTGVADDEEIDRIGDVELIGADYASEATGAPIMVADMKGRARLYRIASGNKGRVLAVAFSRKCDVMVATAVTGTGMTPPEGLVLQFLNGDTISGWAARDLGA